MNDMSLSSLKTANRDTRSPCDGHDVRWRDGVSSAHWLPLVRRQIEVISLLHEGWDGNDAEAPRPKLLEAGARLLEDLSTVPEVPAPHINPTRSGGIQLEWEFGHRYMEIEINGERAANYFFEDASAPEVVEGTIFASEKLDKVIALIIRTAK